MGFLSAARFILAVWLCAEMDVGGDDSAAKAMRSRGFVGTEQFQGPFESS